MYRVKLCSIVLAALLLAGCVVAHGRQPRGRALGHHKHHVHGARCGHVWHGGKLVTVSVGHVHGPSCGHRLHKGRWQIDLPSD